MNKRGVSMKSRYCHRYRSRNGSAAFDHACNASSGARPTSNGGDHRESIGPVGCGGSGSEGDGYRYRTRHGRGPPPPTPTAFTIFPRFPIGTYNIKVERAGFQAAQQSNRHPGSESGGEARLSVKGGRRRDVRGCHRGCSPAADRFHPSEHRNGGSRHRQPAARDAQL